jgi:flagellar hook-basal body complex protein FliE
VSINSINNTLAQIRSASIGNSNQDAGFDMGNFEKLLAESMEQVSRAHQEASELKAAFERGLDDIELPEVMIASQKATVAFEATVEVRNRLLSAYQEIMNMQV